MKKIALVFALFFTLLATTAQTVKEVLNKVNIEYSSVKPLQFETKYNLYRNKETKQVFETYSGVFKKNEKSEIYQKIDQTEFIWNKSYCLKVVHADQIMVLSLSQPVATGEVDMKQLLDYCTIKGFVDKKSYWELTLESKPLSGLSYSKIVIHIGKNYFIQKQLFYYNTEINFSTDYRKQDIDLPVLEIIYSNFNRNKMESTYFDVSKYIVVSKNRIKVTNKFFSYTLEYQREISLK